jgi:hypothetical protein
VSKRHGRRLIDKINLWGVKQGKGRGGENVCVQKDGKYSRRGACVGETEVERNRRKRDVNHLNKVSRHLSCTLRPWKTTPFTPTLSSRSLNLET